MHLLIVDDERQTREGLRQSVQWHTIGITEISAAQNGAEALALLRAKRADAIVCDVRMPRMDGISFITALREAGDSTPVVFLSGHSDKEYLLAAIRLGASDYVEKPVEFDVLLASVKKVLRPTQDRSSAPADPRARLIAAIPEGVRYLAVRPYLTLTEEGAGFGLSDRAARVAEAFNAMKLCAVHDFGVPRYALSLVALRQGDADNGEAVHAKLCAALSGERVATVAGARVEAGEKLEAGFSASLAQLFRYTACALIDGYRLYDASAPDEDALVEAHALAASLAERVDEGLGVAEGAIRALAPRLLRAAPDAALVAMDELESRLAALEQAAGLAQAEFAPQGLRLAARACLVADRAERVARHALARGASKPVRATMAYIEINAAQKINMRSLAAVAYVTPTHLSRIFREETGRTISQYIIDVRMALARGMLVRRHIKLYEVSYRVGLEDSSYFSRVFKKTEGVSPSEFREMHAP